MRKVVALELVSVDGVVEAPEEWPLLHFNDQMGEVIGAALAASDAMPLGRLTYEERRRPTVRVLHEQHPQVRRLEDPADGASSTVALGFVIYGLLMARDTIAFLEQVVELGYSRESLLRLGSWERPRSGAGARNGSRFAARCDPACRGTPNARPRREASR